MWFIVGRVEPQTLWIYPNGVGPIVFGQVLHSLFHDLIRRTFAQRGHTLGCINFFLVDTAAFHTNGIYEERNNMRRHFNFGEVGLGGVIEDVRTEARATGGATNIWDTAEGVFFCPLRRPMTLWRTLWRSS